MTLCCLTPDDYLVSALKLLPHAVWIRLQWQAIAPLGERGEAGPWIEDVTMPF